MLVGVEGANVSRFVFNLPQSRDLEKFKLLREHGLIHRLALGQPNQDDLVEFLARISPARITFACQMRKNH
jgi:hypothetical protein